MRARAVGRSAGAANEPVSLEPDAEPALLIGPLEVEEVLAHRHGPRAAGPADQRAVRVVECRIFAGLTLEETARRSVSPPSRSSARWTTARAWLRKEIGGGSVFAAV